MNTVRILSLIIGVVLLVIALVFCFRGSDKDDFIRMVKMLPEDLGELTFIDVNVLQSDSDMISIWNQAKEQLLGEDIYGENVSKITGFGIAGSENEMMLYAGDFDLEQVTSIIEQGSVESFEYEGVTIWTDQYALSTAVIDGVVFTGSSEGIQRCVDVNKGEGSSLYDNKDARDVISRLPGGYVLGVSVMNSSENSYGLLTAGMAESKNDGNISRIWLYKFQDSDAAQEYITNIGSQIPSDYDVTRDGQYVTISNTSEMPSIIRNGEFEIPSEYINMIEGIGEGQMVMMVGDTDSWVLSITFLNPNTQLMEIDFTIPDRPGAIFEVTSALAKHSINLISVYTKVLVYYETMTLELVADVSSSDLDIEGLKTKLNEILANLRGKYSLDVCRPIHV